MSLSFKTFKSKLHNDTFGVVMQYGLNWEMGECSIPTLLSPETTVGKFLDALYAGVDTTRYKPDYTRLFETMVNYELVEIQVQVQ